MVEHKDHLDDKRINLETPWGELLWLEKGEDKDPALAELIIHYLKGGDLETPLANLKNKTA